MKNTNCIIIERNEEGKVVHFYGAHYVNSKTPIKVYRDTKDAPKAIANIIKGLYGGRDGE